jgi:D-aspartate ligase
MVEIRDTSTPIIILQLAPVQLHHGGLGIARTAGRLGIRVYWVYGDSWAPATLSRYVYRRIFWDAHAPAEALVEYLLKLGRQIGCEPILIPIDDISAVFVTDQAEALREGFVFPDQSPRLARALSSKKELHLLCKKMGMPTPEATFPQSRDDVATFVKTAVFPVVLKRIMYSPEHRAQTKSVAIVDSPKELLKEYKEMETPGEPNVMLQEYIPGGPESVWMFNGFFTNRSECLLGITGKKIRQGPPFTGVTTLGICLKNEAVETMTVDFMREIGYSGIVDMGYRYDRRDGQYKLLDVNPRVGSTFRLFVDSNGMDVVRALYLNLTEQPVRRGVPREGRKWIVEQSDLWSSLQYGLVGKLTLTQWIRSLRGIEEGAWLARDDLVPFGAMCLTSVLKAARKLKDGIKAAQDRAASRGGSPVEYPQNAKRGRQKGKARAASERVPTASRWRRLLKEVFRPRATRR